ncbi:MAG: hypothetical protein Q4B85_07690 [Lachnospiraceae bacterium]|nr:hypothetical protein [Lachnospiraceae bacterium]
MYYSALALTLASGILLGSVNAPVFATNSAEIQLQKALTDGPQDQLVNNMQSLVESLQRLSPEDPGIVQIISDAFSPLTTAAGIYNSATIFLKMTGIMKDGTAESLAKIQETLNDISISISNMNNTLNQVAHELEEIDIYMREANRAQQVENMIDRYSLFDKTYIKELDRIMARYEDEIIQGFQQWYAAAEKAPVSIYFAENPDGKIIQVYSYETDQDPEYSVEDYRIMKEKTIRLDKKSVARAVSNAGTFNVNTYREKLPKALADEIMAQANAGKLTAGKEFYSRWNSSDAEKKAELAAELADQAFNSITSSISKEKMEKSNLATDAYAAFVQCCKDLTSAASAVNAELKILYLTHNFEGEVKEQLLQILDSMNVTIGAYANMTLTMMHQNSSQPEKRIEQVLQIWTDVTEKLNSDRKTALTGYDNYCYLTNSLLTYEERELNFENHITTNHKSSNAAYYSNSFKAESPLRDADRIPSAVEMTMLYHMGKKLNSESTFEEYLKSCRIAFPRVRAKNLLVDFDGWTGFSPNEKIYMNHGRRAQNAGTDYWKTEEFTATVNNGETSAENKYFYDCKVLRGRVFDFALDDISSKKVLAAMAVYGESHWYWYDDEVYLMGYSDEYDYSSRKYDYYIDYNAISHYKIENSCNYKSTFGILLLSPLPKKAAIREDSPIAAFDYCQVVTDFRNMKSMALEEESGYQENPDKENLEMKDQGKWNPEEKLPMKENPEEGTPEEELPMKENPEEGTPEEELPVQDPPVEEEEI